jgi:2'-5' RNA ligase
LTETMRVFIAVPAPEEVREAVRRIVEGLRWSGADVKWVEPENVHITLKFLGDVPLDDVDRIKSALRKGLEGRRAFDLEVAGAGCFPGGRKAPRVIWMGLAGDTRSLEEIALSVDGLCAGLGFSREARPFKAHLTIGRVRRGSGRLRELAEAVGSVTFNPLKLRVDRVNLVRSRLSPKGPTYTVLESAALSDS